MELGDYSFYGGGGGDDGYSLYEGASPRIDTSAFQSPRPTITTEAPPPQTGFGKFASNLVGGIGDEFKKSPLTAFSQLLGLGSTAMGVGNQFRVAGGLDRATRSTEQAQKQAQSAAAPAVEFGTEALNLARAGKLPAPMEAQVQDFIQKAKADARARLASMGLGNSTDITAIDAQIEQQAQIIRASMLGQQQQTGLAGLQTGVSAATGGAQIGQQQQQMLAQLIQGANAQLAKLGATAA